MAQISKLEEAWKENPDATLEDIKNGEGEDEDAIDEVLLRYEDGYQFQNIYGPLVSLEAEYDRAMKEAVRFDGLTVPSSRTRRQIAPWSQSSLDCTRMTPRLNIGDEMKLELPSLLSGTEDDWVRLGTVVRIADDGSELYLQLSGSGHVPSERALWIHDDVRMEEHLVRQDAKAMRKFAVDDSSVSGYLYHRILGHDVKEQLLSLPNGLPGMYSVPGLPDLNHSQIDAVRQVLERPLS